MRFPVTAEGKINEAEAEKMLDKAYAAGVTYFDTAYVLRFIGEEKFKEILKRHGEDKILFATDTPWSDIKNDVNIIKSFGLDKKTENKIFYENAKSLLGI